MLIREVSSGAQAVYLAGLGVLSRREVAGTARASWEDRGVFEDRPWRRVRVVHLYEDCECLAWETVKVSLRRFPMLASLARFGAGPGRRGDRSRTCSVCWDRNPVTPAVGGLGRPGPRGGRVSHLGADLAAASTHTSWSLWVEVVLAGRLPVSDPGGEVHAGVARLLVAQHPLLGPVPAGPRTGRLAEVVAAQTAALSAPPRGGRRDRQGRARVRGGRPGSSSPPRCAVPPPWVWVVVHPRVLDVAVSEVGQLVVAAQLRLVASSATDPVPVAGQGWLVRVPATRLAALRAGGALMGAFAGAVTSRGDAEQAVVEAALRLYGKVPTRPGYAVSEVDELVDALEAARG